VRLDPTVIAASAEVADTAPASLAASFVEIGRSREDRPLFGVRAGSGLLRVSLIAGAHADEPVGPSTLRRLARFLLGASSEAAELRARATFSICPDVNPDGAARNAAWSVDAVPALRRYLLHAVREAPGDDVEFGFPRGDDDVDARPENRAVARFLAGGAPYTFHASLHGMAIAEGAWFLLGREHRDSTGALCEQLARVVEGLGLGLHDWDRRGEKGFERVAAGFSTTPTSTAMRDHFTALGDTARAALFRPSSMELAASFGGSPLCMVSEVPLFLVTPAPRGSAETAAHFLAARDALGPATADLAAGDDAALVALERRFGLTPVDPLVARTIQLAMLLLGSGVVTAPELAFDALP